MSDPLSEVVLQLQPTIVVSKLVEGAGRWCVRREDASRPFYCAVLDGRCELVVPERAPTTLDAGHFILMPSATRFAVMSASGPDDSPPDTSLRTLGEGHVRVGDPNGGVAVRLMVGHCEFASPDAALLSSLLPALVHAPDNARLSALVQLVADEARAQRPARTVILTRLLEVLLVEALRTSSTDAAAPGLLRGLADRRMSAAIRRMHDHPEAPWTVAQLAEAAHLSRTSFFNRFRTTVGIAPMAYLQNWRMTRAKTLLRDPALDVAQVAERVGYGSASSFTAAFTRHVGVPPARFSRETKESTPG